MIFSFVFRHQLYVVLNALIDLYITRRSLCSYFGILAFSILLFFFHFSDSQSRQQIAGNVTLAAGGLSEGTPLHPSLVKIGLIK